MTRSDVSIVVPTYNRGSVLIEMIGHLRRQTTAPVEIVIVDQTERHDAASFTALSALARDGVLNWIRLSRPSIPGAMNAGLLECRGGIVLFLDDDVIPAADLIEIHAKTHRTTEAVAVVGRIDQPWDIKRGVWDGKHAISGDPDHFAFNAPQAAWTERVMAGNLSVKRESALQAGGFDENFKGAAYRFEAEFAERLVQQGGRIRYEPRARLEHLKFSHGGTRTFGVHYDTLKPYHSVGEYYYLLSVKTVTNRRAKIPLRLLRSITTRHHLRKPWAIPKTLIAELSGLAWAAWLCRTGPKLIAPPATHRAWDARER